MSRRFPGVVIWLFLCAPGYAHTLGTITGEVKDQSSATIPGATVTAQTVQNNVELHVEETLRVNFTLDVGAITETTEVSAAVTLIATENATVGTVIENRRIVELPGQDIPNTGSQTYRLNLVPGQDPNEWRKTPQQWFNTAAFAMPAQFTYGNAGRNIVIGPGIFNVDMSLMRNVRRGGARSLQVRLEAFNVFNNPVWGDPNLSMANPTLFGTINTTRTAMRELQIGAKFSF